jgi:hypothetical protein
MQKWAKRTSCPFPCDHAPELDTTDLLDHKKSTFYQSQVGVLRWIVELGRIDIITEVLELSTFLAMPRKGHLEAYSMYSTTWLRIVFDPSYLTIDMTAFKDKCDCKAFYCEAQEAIPPSVPTPRGKDVDLRMFVDSDHALTSIHIHNGP